MEANLVVLGILFLAVLGIVCYITKQRKYGSGDPPEEREDDFIMYNYLASDIQVSVRSNLRSRPHVLARVSGKNKGRIRKAIADKHITCDALLDIHLLDPHTHQIVAKYATHIINEPIHLLHIGMVTTRFIGSSTDSLRVSTTSGNAIQGNAWLKIHNLTEVPIRLNDDIEIAPHSVFRYLGYVHQGVTLGTIFKDQDGLYPDFQYLHPDSDLYYGVISDIKQPTYGCFQLEFHDVCDQNQTLWPFELGQM